MGEARKSDGDQQNSINRELTVYMDYICDRYIEKHSAYSDLVSSIAPHVETLLDSEDALRALVVANLDLVPSSKRSAVTDILGEALKKENEQFSTFVDEVLNVFGGERWCYKYIEGVHKLLIRQPRLPVLLESLVVAVVSNFEVQLAQVAAAFYREAPGVLDSSSSEKEFSLKDLKEVGNIDDAVEMAISRRVEGLLFGSLSDWRKFFNEKMKMKLDELCIDWNITREVIQRRHVIVHNGGMASRRYISQVEGLDGVGNVEIGAPLICDQSYVERSMDELLTLGVLLAHDFCRRFKGDPRYVALSLGRFAYRMLVEGRWRVTVRVCSYALDNLNISEDQSNTFRVNSWIARKELGEVDQVRSEVDKWDISALSPRFKLARYCLMGEREKSLELMADLISIREVSLEDALEWPLLRELREDERYPMLLAPLRIGEGDFPIEGKLAMSPGSTTVHVYPCIRAGKNARLVQMKDVIQRDGRPCQVCSPSLGN